MGRGESTEKSIAFIGGGNMAEAIMAGLIFGGAYAKENVYVVGNTQARLEYLRDKFNLPDGNLGTDPTAV